MLADAGIPVRDVEIVTVGGGIGSFVFCDLLRIGGMATSSIRVLGNGATPWENYEYLTRVSQVPSDRRALPRPIGERWTTAAELADRLTDARIRSSSSCAAPGPVG